MEVSDENDKDSRTQPDHVSQGSPPWVGDAVVWRRGDLYEEGGEVMTYQDKYNEWLNSLYRCGCDGVTTWDDLPRWITGGMEPAELMEENDPTMYR